MQSVRSAPSTRLVFCLFAVFCIFAGSAQAIQWPFEDGLTAPPINNGFGDWASHGVLDSQGNPVQAGRFHPGIDMPKAEGTVVKAVEGGCVVFSNTPNEFDPVQDQGIIVIAPLCSSPQGWGYVHVRGPNFSVGQTVSAGDTIATVAPMRADDGTVLDHLHLARFRKTETFIDNILQNPLSFYGGLIPVQDPLLDVNKIYFVPDQTWLPSQFATLPTGERILHEDVDIVAEPHTRFSNDSRAGTFSLSFDVSSPPAGASGIPRRTLARFLEVQPTAVNSKFPLVYEGGLASPSGNFHGHYIVTNSAGASAGTDPPPANDATANVVENAWHTRVRVGINDDVGPISPSQKARANAEAKYRDGKYAVGLRVGTFQDASTLDRSRAVIVDNFRPFVAKVTIDNGSAYSKEWSFDNSSGKFNSGGPTVAQPIAGGAHAISVLFSEPVESPVLTIDTLAGQVSLTSNEPVGNRRNFSGAFDVGGTSGIQDGSRTMTFTANDLGGNALLALGPSAVTIDPATQLTRAGGTMQGVGGSDTSVSFRIADSNFSTRSA